MFRRLFALFFVFVLLVVPVCAADDLPDPDYGGTADQDSANQGWVEQGYDFFLDGFCPPDYVGVTLPYLDGVEYASYSYNNAVSWYAWQVQSGTVNNLPDPLYKSTQTVGFSYHYLLNMSDIPAHSISLSYDFKDILSSEYVHCMSYTVLSFTATTSAGSTGSASYYSYFCCPSSTAPSSINPYTLNYDSGSGRFSLSITPASNGNWAVKPGGYLFLPANVKILLRMQIEGSAGIQDNAVIRVVLPDGSLSPTVYSTRHYGNTIETVLSTPRSVYIGADQPGYFSVAGAPPPSSSGQVTLVSMGVQLYDDTADTVVGAINNQTTVIQDQYNQTQSDFKSSVNPGQAVATDQLQGEIDKMEQFDQQIFEDVNNYTKQLDFGLSDWGDAASGISYISSIFMMVWNNSPKQPIILSLMLGLCMLLLGRGARLAGEVRRSQDRAERAQRRTRGS